MATGDLFVDLLTWLRAAQLVRVPGALLGWSGSSAVLFWSDAEGTLWALPRDSDEPSPLIDLATIAGLLEPIIDHPPRTPAALAALTVQSIDLAAGQVIVTTQGRTVRVGLDPPAAEVVQPRHRDQARLLRRARRTGNRDLYEVAAPDRSRFAGTDRTNLYVRDAGSNTLRWLTADGTEDLRWGLFSTSWSPDGKSVATVREDDTDVPRQPLVDWLNPDLPVDFVPRARTDTAPFGFTAHAIDVDNAVIVDLDCGAVRGDRLWCRGWSADSTTVFILKAGRDLRHLQLIAADRATGQASVIVDELIPTFLSWSDIDALALGIRGWSQVLWRSERDGWAHLYRYDTAAPGPPLQITSGDFEVARVEAIDEVDGWVYFAGRSELAPYDTQLYRARLDGTGQERLTDEPGQHALDLSPDRTRFLDRHSSLLKPPRIDLRAADGRHIRGVAASDDSELALRGWLPPEDISVRAEDGSLLIGALYAPSELEPARRYPVLDYIYGGPQTIYAPKEFLDPVGITARAYAEAGFVVIVIDARGTPGRGKAFHDHSFRQFGSHVVADHRHALAELALDRPWMDLKRVGVFGGSWGGHMTIRALIEAPDVFRAGAATAPSVVLAHSGYSIEPFTGLADENPEGYEAGDLVAKAALIQGPLLLIHGTDDANVPLSASLTMARALADADKDVEMLVLPGENHVLTGPAWRLAHRRRLDFFTRHLL